MIVTPAQAAAELLTRRAARARLLPFIEYTHPAWDTEPHHERMCHYLELLERRAPCPYCGRMIDKLANFAPPRSGKTETSLRRFSAWIMGRHPNWNVISAMANGSLASDTGGEIRDIVASPEFHNIFPDVSLQKDAKAANRWVVQSGKMRGVFYTAGVDASFPGRGANCIAAGQPVLTKRGWVPIEEVQRGDLVLTHRMQWRRVKATVCNGFRKVVRLSGQHVTLVCTDDHLVLTSGGWRHAKTAKTITGIDLPKLPKEFRPEVVQAKSSAKILQPGMLQYCKAPRVCSVEAKLFGVWPENQSAGQFKREKILLQEMLRGVCSPHRVAEDIGHDSVCPLRQENYSKIFHDEVLQHGVQKCGAFTRHGRSEQFESQARQTCRDQNAQISEEVEAIARWSHLCRMWNCGESDSASHRRRQDKQLPDEFDRYLSAVSYEISQVEKCGIAEVYDLEVEEDHSFHVGASIVHNCLNIDDPHKSAQEADSQRMRDLAAKFYFGDAIQRLESPSIQILTNTRRHMDDLAGRILPPTAEWAQTGDEQFFCCANGWHVLRFRAIEHEGTPYEVAMRTRASQDQDPLEYMKEIRSLYLGKGESRYWASEFQQEPTVEEGTFIKREWFAGRYEKAPPHMRIYIASDYAVTEKKGGNDPDWTEHGVFGMASDGGLYVLDWWCGRTESDVWVEKLLDLVEKWKPLAAFGEKGQIINSIGPYLERRKMERRVYFNLELSASTKDKAIRAQSFRALAASGMIMFPRAEWAERVIDQCAEFPSGNHDDAFDVLSLMCSSLDNAPAGMAPSRRLEEQRDRWARKRKKVSSWRTV